MRCGRAWRKRGDGEARPCRSRAPRDAPLPAAVHERAKKHGGFYLASIGGAAANLAEHCIKKVEMQEYPKLGMEAIWRIEVQNFPAFIVIDDKGNDFFKTLNLR
jgi:fumarate hydratase class I